LNSVNRVTRSASRRARGEREVLPQLFEPAPPHRFARLLRRDGEIAERASCRVARIGRRHAVRDVPFDLSLEMVAQLFVELGLGRAAKHERFEANEERGDHERLLRAQDEPEGM
jgi:hypothetical protein